LALVALGIPPGLAARSSGVDAGSRPATGGFKRPTLEHGLLTIIGTAASDTVALRLRVGDPRVLEVDVGDDGTADFSFARADVSRIDIEARAGDDRVRIDESNGAFTDTIPTTINGGAGNDTLVGGSGAETFTGGAGNDTIDGGGGNDDVSLGDGDDVFSWAPGDGSDIVHGQAGTDTIRFEGSAADEQFTLSASGSGRLRIHRDLDDATVKANGVEQVDLDALGGADTITVGNLTTTGVARTNLDLGAGDGQPDRVIVEGTDAADSITIAGSDGTASVTGLSATVNIANADPAGDALTVDAIDGDDAVTASGLAANVAQLTIDGGPGADVLVGSAGNDTILGGDGDDVLIGGPGFDVLDGGTGNNILIQD
jgi:Ca2+-binding RTX toxin-like protein